MPGIFRSIAMVAMRPFRAAACSGVVQPLRLASGDEDIATAGNFWVEAVKDLLPRSVVQLLVPKVYPLCGFQGCCWRLESLVTWEPYQR
jgi:hypothetical protein